MSSCPCRHSRRQPCCHERHLAWPPGQGVDRRHAVRLRKRGADRSAREPPLPIVSLAASSLTFQVAVAIALGLVAGSFLCLVAHRLPRMLRILPLRRHVWGSFNLWCPPSHCPACGHYLKAIENIPIISWALQGGRCRACGTPIGWREPAFELGGAALAALSVVHWGWSVEAFCATLFLWMLLLASAIDAETGHLPDEATMPILWAGLLTSVSGEFADPRSAVLGVAAGYVGLTAVRIITRWLTGREGLGGGDAILLAAIGAWTGWQSLPSTLLVAASVALLPALWLRVAHPGRIDHYVPFGPSLSVAGALALFFPEAFGDPTMGALFRVGGSE